MVTRCARVTSSLRLSPVTGSASVTGTAPCLRRASSFANCCGERGEAPVAFRVGRAAREHAVERALRLDRDVRHQRERRRHDAVQHDRARVLREAARIVLRDARAVGAAEDVDLRVAERRAHGVEVAHRDARRVELRAAGKRRQAGLARACAVPRAGSRRPRARRPACRSRGGWSRRCRAGPPARGRARGGCRRRRRAAARSRGSIPGPARRR